MTMALKHVGILAAGASIAASLGLADELDLSLGKALFERQWVQAPASVDSADGLGPLFNASACNTCHKGGGSARFSDIDGVLGVGGLIIRLGDVHGRADPYYGRQLQERAVPGLAAEARIFPHLEKGAEDLERMVAKIDLNGPPLAATTHTELRVAPSLAGRSLIERVSPESVLALADPDDRDHDGISGRARLINGELGRFGLKATGRSVHEQVADAAAFDIGLSSPGRPQDFGDCTPLEHECLHMASGRSAAMDGEEISDQVVSLIGAYVESLKPPPQHRADPPLAFTEAGCAQCHVPNLKAADGSPLPVFTDLLLHDLGDGLAGGFGDDFATPNEWRTAPLIDLDPRGGKRRYLHDGRAASIDEAIRWHSGEAAAAKARFEALSPEEKAALIAFVSSL
jgi:CxxC motif-containing protein (DUF1111 family)